ncbi:ABC-type spermidine/putrescine transport system permease subunit I [Saccharopolyspora lacisalsi]|uniref:ABC-type spermidine/putrescine transport system permease subunit I n=1 Tax=Halosaccharopolyspora lacisalsi TaxID=1000566 RepID=A0A839E254_9PSEU|nr:hypothetical protein [Halosaccharopolyspora lacisalsi]MBA8826636.1 ABC-type spermidine/putrescine transport system permease subunit I [Halosaccharopolyspora lacisalsi]
MTTPTDSTPGVPRYVQVTKWIWLVGMAVALLGTVYAIAVAPSVFTGVALVITLVQAALAVPAALVLAQRKRWARMVLMILALLSLGSLYSALQAQAWPSLVLNLALAITFGLLQDQSVREFFGLPRQPWLRRRLRGSAP